MKTTPKPELLAPAGDWESLRAAVANGADAVYFGLDAFNARARASNFSMEELPEVMGFLHARNVRGFVALNVLIFSDELPRITNVLTACAAAGVDAVIVQDFGLIRLIREMVPELPIHASTQMTLTEPRGLEFLKRYGVERAVLARELSLDEIRKVTAQSSMPVEVFVHGALCVSYSGQCLTSEALGGRSANRGQCAQACRLPYEMIVDGQPRELGEKAYLLSPQDLAAFDLIAPLIDAGVISFKIEGRLKGGPYVAATCQTYRSAIDAALDHRPFQLDRKKELELAQTFSRGLTHGFLDGNDHQKLVHARFPKSRGIILGRVLGLTRQGMRVLMAETLPVDQLVRAGDGILFDLGKPAEREPGGRIWKVNPLQGREVEFLFEPDSLDRQAIPLNCTVWKTDDPDLRKRLTHTFSQDHFARRIPVTAKLKGEIGGGLELEFSSTGVSGTANWPGPLEVATKRATTPEEIRAALERLGETPFELGELNLKVPNNALVPKSILNDLRRRAIQELIEKQKASSVRTIRNPNALKEMRTRISKANVANPDAPNLTVLVRNLAQLDAVLPLKPAFVYADFEDLRHYKTAVEKARSAGVLIGLATNRIWKPGEEGFQSLVVRAAPDAVLVRNLGSIEYFQKELPGTPLIGDYSLNVANELTATGLQAEGLIRMVPSFDLNWPQLNALVFRSDPNLYEPVIHQHMPMFHMEHCVFAAFLSTGKDHRDCGRPCDIHKVELKDRTGAHFPVLPDTGCRNTVFNSVPQSAAEFIGRMKSKGIRWFRVDLLRETPDEIPGLLERYRRLLDGADDGREVWKQLNALNQLGVTRGTLQMV